MTSVRQRLREQRSEQRIARLIATAQSEAERTAHIWDGLRVRIAAIPSGADRDEAWRQVGEYLRRFAIRR